MNVYTFTDESFIYPIYISKYVKNGRKHINIFMIESKNEQAYFCWIKNLSALVRSQGKNINIVKFFVIDVFTLFQTTKVYKNILVELPDAKRTPNLSNFLGKTNRSEIFCIVFSFASGKIESGSHLGDSP